MGQKPFPEPAKCVLMRLMCSWQQDAPARVGQGGRVLLQHITCPCLVMSPCSHHLQVLLTPLPLHPAELGEGESRSSACWGAQERGRKGGRERMNEKWDGKGPGTAVRFGSASEM